MSDNKTALLVMDVQQSIVDRIDEQDKYLAKLAEAVDYAHAHDVRVIYVVVGFRAGLPEISPSNKSFSTIGNSGQGDRLIDPRPVIEPKASDLVVIKKRVSAFTGSDLEVILRSNNLSHLVLCGIATSGVVLSTVREAADKDYRLSVLSDLCVDFDGDVNEVLLNKVFVRQAEVMTARQWMEKQ